MNNLRKMNITLIDFQCRPISLKTFGMHFGIVNHYTRKNLYREYLELAGKKPNMTLTTLDFYRIDEIQI